MTLKRTSLNHLIWAPKSRLEFGDVAVAVVGWDFDGEAMSGSEITKQHREAQRRIEVGMRKRESASGSDIGHRHRESTSGLDIRW